MPKFHVRHRGVRTWRSRAENVLHPSWRGWLLLAIEAPESVFSGWRILRDIGNLTAQAKI